jgi:DNA-binding MarR family transcriptional regulator
MPFMGIYSDALFTKTQQRVLGLLFGQPDRSFYANEIIELAASGSGSVQRELARLEQADLVTVRRIGNQKHYQANRSTPIFAELRGIVVKTFGVVDILYAALAPLLSSIELAFIYGSVAKGTESGSSDIDLMVIGSDVSNGALLETLAPASAQLGRSINPTLYTAGELRQRVADGKAFVLRVLEQPKIFVKGSDHDLTRVASLGEPGANRKT